MPVSYFGSNNLKAKHINKIFKNNNNNNNQEKKNRKEEVACCERQQKRKLHRGHDHCSVVWVKCIIYLGQSPWAWAGSLELTGHPICEIPPSEFDSKLICKQASHLFD